MERSFVGAAGVGLALFSAAFLGVALTFALEPQLGLAAGAAITGAILLMFSAALLLSMRSRYFRPAAAAQIPPQRPISVIRTLAKDEPFLVLGAAVIFAGMELVTGGHLGRLVKFPGNRELRRE